MISFVANRLPQGLEALTELALDLRWTWNHATDALWESLSADIWSRTRNPWLILRAVSRRRLEQLASDAGFRQRLAGAVAERRQYLDQPAWFERSGAEPAPRVAYFCLEYGLAEALPLYSGGLGILAGDTLKTASDLGLPMIAVGLLYQQGYARQMLDSVGAQQEFYPANVPGDLPISPALGPDGEWLSVTLRLPGRDAMLRVWQAQVGRVPLLLLDSNHPFNSPADRGITNTLYPAAPEARFLQEIALGIGGWRALAALGHQPEVCHLNEGHAALATLERARQFMRSTGIGFREALWATRAGNVFTTHTSVAAAFDVFPIELARKYGRVYARDIGIDEDELARLGQPLQGSRDEPFNMTFLALRSCGAVNGVSRIHGEVSRRLFGGLFPRWPRQEVPVSHITNGVHAPSWDSPAADRLWTETCGKGRWRGDLKTLACDIQRVDDHALWRLIGDERLELVNQVRSRLKRQLGQRGLDAATVEAAAHVLDPNVLTLGLARRFTAYKRPNLLLTDPDRLARLLTHGEKPVQIVVAGKAHPQDAEGKRLIRAWTEFVQRPDVRARVVFVEDYDVNLAQCMVQGVDAWINTPRRPWEACGTSGMKVLVNGGLNISVLDGWWDEAYSADAGWAIRADRDSDAATDRAEAEQLYTLLEREVVPLFYDRDAEGLPRQWLARIRGSLTTLAPHYSSNRMLDEYLDALYRPAAAAHRRRCADGARLAAELLHWQRTLTTGWSQIRFGKLDIDPIEGGWSFRVPLYLGEVPADAVAVQIYAEPRGAGDTTHWTMRRQAPIDGALNAWNYETTITSARPATDFTPRVLPHHPEAIVPLEVSLIRWWP
ncbi:alpha-glucan family phosphorylase [Fontimonas sp. SYSU GA230001]|uniref:alpha-glucan family phosphorylase n=1 Tax=Fontimonas sp. SYSU GA230001 TaxID=3142450 RepID=UPI0032B321DF